MADGVSQPVHEVAGGLLGGPGLGAHHGEIPVIDPDDRDSATTTARLGHDNPGRISIHGCASVVSCGDGSAWRFVATPTRIPSARPGSRPIARHRSRRAGYRLP